MTEQMRQKLAPLFADMHALIGMREAALTGQFGAAFVDAAENPRCAVMTAGDVVLCGGVYASCGCELLGQALASQEREWLVYAPSAWHKELAQNNQLQPVTRYAFDHDVQPSASVIADILRTAPQNLTFQPVEGEWVEWCRKQEWSRDFVSGYPDEKAYAANGLGTLVMRDEEPVAGASSYLSYPHGIEVQVQTREGFEGHGYATLAAAKLIEMGHAVGKLVTWDAANPASQHMAEKLGYQPAGAYTVFELHKQNV